MLLPVLLLACSPENDLNASKEVLGDLDDTTPEGDSPVTEDTGPPPDEETGDRGDSGPPADTSPTPDSSPPTDTSPPPDTAPVDTAPSPDTGEPAVEEGPPAPDVPCLEDTLDASLCVPDVAAWNETTSNTYATVDEAVDDAASGDTVVVCAGTWTETVTVPAVDLTLRGYGASTTEIDAAGAGIGIELTGGDLVLQDLAVLNGSGYQGAGLYAPSGDLVTCGVRFEENDASSGGGGVYLGAGTWQGEDVEFVANTSGYEAGGAYLDGTTATLVGVTFEGNEAPSTGGGMELREGTLDLWDTTFESNEAGYEGGGLALSSTSAASSATLTRVTFTGNVARHGGGMYEGGYVTAAYALDACVFEDNEATTSGGAIFSSTWADDTVTISDSTFTGNTAPWAGAVQLHGQGNPSFTLDDCVLDANTATTGGAIALDNPGTATLVMDGGSVTSNVAVSSGGMAIDADSTVTVTSSDWGSGGTDNTPDDATGYTGYGPAATFTCSGTSCF